MIQKPSPVSEAHRKILLETARESIRHGFEHDRPLPVDPPGYPEELRAPAPVFVTLTRQRELRGCIGALESNRSLVENVAYYAHAAAFSDSRFPPLTPAELPGLEIAISILSPLEVISFSSEADLVWQLRPGLDGLLLEEGCCRGTFLPSVWEAIPEPVDFVRRLKVKAGLDPDYWSAAIQVSRYTTLCIEEEKAP
jgi:AmmeMemoRadiSam system protein A